MCHGTHKYRGSVGSLIYVSEAKDTDFYVTSIYRVTRTMEVAATDQQEKMWMRRQEGLEQISEEC